MMKVRLYLAVGLPTLLLLIGQFLNWSAVKDVSNHLVIIEKIGRGVVLLSAWLLKGMASAMP